MRKSLLVVLLLSLLVCDFADARVRLLRRRSRSSGSNVGVEWNGPVGIIINDQANCQRKANFMATNGVFSHGAGGLAIVGNFEGIGMGGEGCATCRPSSNLTLTGDASARGSNGMIYRVRSWR